MLSYRISYSDNLQIYTNRKHFSDVGFKASKIHLKIGRIFFGSVYIHVIIHDIGFGGFSKGKVASLDRVKTGQDQDGERLRHSIREVEKSYVYGYGYLTVARY